MTAAVLKAQVGNRVGSVCLGVRGQARQRLRMRILQNGGAEGPDDAVAGDGCRGCDDHVPFPSGAPRCVAICAAHRIACTMLASEARPVPATSKAVP